MSKNLYLLEKFHAVTVPDALEDLYLSNGFLPVLTFDELADFPATGATRTVYKATDTEKLYLFDGEDYDEIDVPVIIYTAEPVDFTPENVINKATGFGVINNVKYPSTAAVEARIDSKISAAALTVAGLASILDDAADAESVALADVVFIVQGGVIKKTTVADLLAAE